LLDALQTFVDRRRIEVENDLRSRLAAMSAEEFRELPAIDPSGLGETDVVHHAPGARPN